MLPILISVSLAPGSYFFWAFAAVIDSATAAAHAATPIRHLLKANIVSLPFDDLFSAHCVEASFASSE
jgi:hypothetical protein